MQVVSGTATVSDVTEFVESLAAVGHVLAHRCRQTVGDRCEDVAERLARRRDGDVRGVVTEFEAHALPPFLSVYPCSHVRGRTPKGCVISAAADQAPKLGIRSQS